MESSIRTNLSKTQGIVTWWRRLMKKLVYNGLNRWTAKGERLSRRRKTDDGDFNTAYDAKLTCFLIDPRASLWEGNKTVSHIFNHLHFNRLVASGLLVLHDQSLFLKGWRRKRKWCIALSVVGNYIYEDKIWVINSNSFIEFSIIPCLLSTSKLRIWEIYKPVHYRSKG